MPGVGADAPAAHGLHDEIQQPEGKQEWNDLEAAESCGGSGRSTCGRIVDSPYFPHGVLLSAQVRPTGGMAEVAMLQPASMLLKHRTLWLAVHSASAIPH